MSEINKIETPKDTFQQPATSTQSAAISVGATQIDPNDPNVKWENYSCELENTKSAANLLAKVKSSPLKDKIKSGKKTEKADKSDKVFSVSSVLTRKRDSFDNFSNEFFQKPGMSKFKLPISKLKQLYLEILRNDIRNETIVRADKNRAAAAFALKQRVLASLAEEGKKFDPSQVDKVFEFLLDATEMTAEEENSPDAGYLLEMREVVILAKELHYNDYKIEGHENDIDLGDKVIFPIASKIVDSEKNVFQGDDESDYTAKTAQEIREWLHSHPDAVQEYDHCKRQGLTFENVKEIVSIKLREIRLALRSTALEPAEKQQIIRKGKECQDLLQAYRFFEERDSLVHRMHAA